MSDIGWVHTVFAGAAILAGGVVCALPKGTRWHRTVGHVYATAMVGVVATSFALYGLTGGFGVFHFAAIVAGVTLATGLYHVLARRPRGQWLEAHAIWMSWSYVGLLCAFAAETLTRFVMPLAAAYLSRNALWPVFWTSVGVATFAVAGLGWWIIRSRLPGVVASMPEAMRRERTSERGAGEPAATR